MKFCSHIPTFPRKILVPVWPPLLPPGPGGLETFWAEGHIFLPNKRCSAGCKLTWAAPGTSASIFYLFKNGYTDVCLLVCGGLIEIQTPALTWMKFCTHIPTCPRNVLVQVWPLPLSPFGPGGPETRKAEEHIFENCLQNKRGSAGCILTLAVRGLSAISLYINGCTDVCLFVCLSIGMWRANGNPHPYTDLDEIFHAYPHLSQEGFGAILTHARIPLGLEGLKL